MKIELKEIIMIKNSFREKKKIESQLKSKTTLKYYSYEDETIKVDTDTMYDFITSVVSFSDNKVIHTYSSRLHLINPKS